MNSLKVSFPYVENVNEINANGTKTTGILTKIEEKLISISQNKGFTFSKFRMSMDVHYEYESHRGNNNVGKSRTINFALTNNKSIGATIRILVSRNGKFSCLYPELIAKTNGWKDKYVA